jgi:uncharacterized protein (TIGR03546 family)
MSWPFSSINVRFKEILTRVVGVFKAHQEPHEIALGVAIGCFIAVLPLYGLHTLLCIGVALLIPRANKLAILLGTNVSLPPTVPIITWTGYDIGRFLLSDKHYPPLSWEYFRNFSISRVSEFYYPLFVGSVVLGILCAAVAFLVTFAIAHLFKRRRLHAA